MEKKETLRSEDDHIEIYNKNKKAKYLHQKNTWKCTTHDFVFMVYRHGHIFDVKAQYVTKISIIWKDDILGKNVDLKDASKANKKESII